jgi:hypothetical protein
LSEVGREENKYKKYKSRNIELAGKYSFKTEGITFEIPHAGK